LKLTQNYTLKYQQTVIELPCETSTTSRVLIKNILNKQNLLISHVVAHLQTESSFEKNGFLYLIGLDINLRHRYLLLTGQLHRLNSIGQSSS